MRRGIALAGVSFVRSITENNERLRVLSERLHRVYSNDDLFHNNGPVLHFCIICIIDIKITVHNNVLQVLLGKQRILLNANKIPGELG